MVLALVATGLAIMTAGSSDQGDPGSPTPVASLTGEPTTEAGATRMPDAAAIAGIVSAARPSLVALRVSTSAGTSVGTGLVVESGGIIVTASQLLFRATIHHCHRRQRDGATGWHRGRGPEVRARRVADRR